MTMSSPTLLQALKIQDGDYYCAKFEFCSLVQQRVRRKGKFVRPLAQDWLSFKSCGLSSQTELSYHFFKCF